MDAGAIVMPQTADFLLERLRGWGVHRISGCPGDGINAILGVFGRAGGDPEFIRPRHEEIAFKTALTPAVRGFRQKMVEYYEKLPGRDR